MLGTQQVNKDFSPITRWHYIEPEREKENIQKLMCRCQSFEFGLDFSIRNYEIIIILGVVLIPNLSKLVMTFCARNMKPIDYWNLRFTN